MNNLLSYCGLVDAKIRASDNNLPVTNMMLQRIQVLPRFEADCLELEEVSPEAVVGAVEAVLWFSDCNF